METPGGGLTMAVSLPAAPGRSYRTMVARAGAAERAA